jgi:hypothetical protein
MRILMRLVMRILMRFASRLLIVLLCDLEIVLGRDGRAVAQPLADNVNRELLGQFGFTG